MAAGDVFVHLFEWKWTDIATECETVLGPAGFHAVQVSPPEEHSIVPSHDWSERYQPVSYSVARSRSGTEAEFIDMVTRCHAAGVDIIVDAVINHMTNYPSPGVGSNGTAYSKYSYPGLYTSGDFHTPCALNNYQSAANVQDCELLSLPDLNTGLASVRLKIAGYGGLALSVPIVMWQVWRFIVPGLHPRERRYAVGFSLLPLRERDRGRAGALTGARALWGIPLASGSFR